MATRSAVAWLCSVAFACLARAEPRGCEAQSDSPMCTAPRPTESALLQAVFRNTRTATASTGVTDMMDVAYGSHAQQAVDFFWPDTEEPQGGWPMVASFHGKYGDKANMHGFCHRVISESEFTRACMAANYRDYGFSFGVKVTDIGISIKWLVRNAASYKVNNKMIILYGYSQGGMLVNSFIWDHNDLANQYVSAAILCAAIGGLSLKKTPSDRHHPPLLVISSKNDPLINYKHSGEFLATLAPVGDIVHRLTYLEAGHHPQSEPSFWSQIDTFLDSPSTYEAPDPLTLTTTPAPPACKASCKRNAAEWSKKCSWRDCSACGECACEDSCYKKKPAWSKKCSWETCSGCDECEAPDPVTSTTTPVPTKCKRSCKKDQAEWSEKCSWKNCGACDECEAPDPVTSTTTPVPTKCKQRKCRRDQAEWSEKCSWTDCGACDECIDS